MQYLVQAFYMWCNSNNIQENLYFILSSFCLLSISLLISFVLQIIIHELGHGIAGVVTGYELILIRVFHFIIIRNKDRWSLKRYSDTCSFGQCLFAPPSVPKDKKPPFAFMTLGGCILNLGTGLLTLSMALGPLSIPFVIRINFYFLSFYGIGFAIINGIPLKKFGFSNDGSNYYHMKNTKNVLECSYYQMSMLKQLIEGKTYGEIPFDKIQPINKNMLVNPVLGYQKIVEYYYFLDIDDLDNAGQCLKEFEAVWDVLHPYLKSMVLIETLFMEIYTHKRPEIIQELYSLTKNTIRKSRYDIHLLRVRFAYEHYQSCRERNTVALDKHGNIQQLAKLQIEINRAKMSYPYLGEVLFCEILMERLTKKQINYKTN